jgi:glycosyltransferase involved in cell wall biosynthesis
MDVSEQLLKRSVVLVLVSISRQVELEQYFLDKVKTLAVVTMALPSFEETLSQCRLYEQGKVVKRFNLHDIKIPSSLPLQPFLRLIAHTSRVIAIISSILSLGRRFDIYFGDTYLCTPIGLILRRMKIVDKVIYYNGDYFPSPAKIGVYTLLNGLARLIDRFCTNRCDIVWNASPILIQIKKQKKITSKRPYNIVVPPGIDTKSIYQRPLSQIDTTSIGFIGIIGRYSGLDLFLEALLEIKKRIPNIKLNIIGSDPYEKYGRRIRDKVQKMGLENNVIFWGFVADKARVREILSNCAIGIAPYVPSIHSYTPYTEPGKVKEYLASGLPVVITKVPRIAFEIESRKSGFAVEYSKEELVVAVLKLLTDRELLEEFRKNALQLALEYDWETILNKAWSESTVLFCNEETKG